MTFRQAALALAALLASVPATVRAGTVWTAVASEKIRPGATPRADTSASIAAAKNEFEAFQVVVTGPATGVSASASDLAGPGTIKGVKLFREELLDLQHPSAADGGTGQYPDALVPDVDDVVGEKRNAFPFDVPAGQSRAIWVELHVPADAPAGAYAGSVTVHSREGDTAVPVALTVWDFALPSTASLKSAFALTGGALPAMHRGLSAEDMTKLRQHYGQLALDHRITLSDLWDDGRSEGWSHFDNAFGPFLDGTASTQLQGARVTSVRSGANLSSASEHADWATHFKSRGWFDRLFQYTCDEPPITCSWSDITSRAQNAKSADPAFRTLVTTGVEDAQSNGVLGSIDLMVPLVNFIDDRPNDHYGWRNVSGDDRAAYDGFLQTSAPAKKELWLYQSCMSHGCGGTVDIGSPSADQLYFTGWPSYMVDASATRSRAMEWLSFRFGATGELYYETAQAYYARDPWTGGVYDFNGNGDGTLFYPGTVAHIGGSTDIPVASIRLKMIREGMEDYEYLKLLSDAGGAAEAKEIARTLFPHAWQSDAKPADVMAARQKIAERILALKGKTPPTASVTTPAGAGAASQVGNASSGTGLAQADAIGATGCGASTGHRGGLLTVVLVPIALVLHRLRRRRA